jgi:hypothetical protein
VVTAVRSGGDTDTNVAIAGDLLDAVHGRVGVPVQWMDRVTFANCIRNLCPGNENGKLNVFSGAESQCGNDLVGDLLEVDDR